MEHVDKYQPVIASLVACGARAEFHSPGQLVVCLEEPFLVGRIWITWRDGWFISTWTPAVYSVPDDVDIVTLCLACVREENGPFFTIPDSIVEGSRLRRLDENEVTEFLEQLPSPEERNP